MDKVTDKSRDDLEHAGIEAMIESMAADIDRNFKVLHAENRAEFDVIAAQLKIIEKETKLTNGRVDSLEKDTKILSFFMNNKIALVLVMIGLYTVYNADLNRMFLFLKSLL